MNIEYELREAIKEDLSREPHERRDHVFYASEAGYCPRKIFYSFMNKKPSTGASGTFKIGDLLHEFIQDVMGKSSKISYKKVEAERTIMIWTPEFNISGKIDVYGIKEDGSRDVYELKSRSPVYWDKFTKPYDTHIAQLQMYLLAERVDYGHLIYMNKNNLDLKIFKVDRDEKLINDILLKFKKVQESIDKGVPPKDKGSSWECRYCPYTEECMLDDATNNKTRKKSKS